MADGSSAEYRKKARATVWNVNVQKQQMTRRPEAAAALSPVAPLQYSAPTVKQMATTNVSQQLMIARRPSLSAVAPRDHRAQVAAAEDERGEERVLEAGEVEEVCVSRILETAYRPSRC